MALKNLEYARTFLYIVILSYIVDLESCFSWFSILGLWTPHAVSICVEGRLEVSFVGADEINTVRQPFKIRGNGVNLGLH